MVWAGKDLALGQIGGSNTFRLRSSVSMVPVGSGKIILFGFFLMQSMADNGPELAAMDIAQILCSGVLLMNASSTPWYRSYHMWERGSITGNCGLAIDQMLWASKFPNILPRMATAYCSDVSS